MVVVREVFEHETRVACIGFATYFIRYSSFESPVFSQKVWCH
jgi:hypothetical protein